MKTMYETQANKIAKELGIKLTVLDYDYKDHFNDGIVRCTFKLKLSRGKRSYTFDFGQSVANAYKVPTMYDVLSCMQKYDVGNFENFCEYFGYDTDSKKALETYKAVVKEYAAVKKLFTDDELELLSEIN